jgi:hypothetical protein
MKLTQRQLRSIITEELADLEERSLSGPGFDRPGSERRIPVEAGDKWKKLSANANMMNTGVERLKEAILDQDEDEAAKWVQQVQKYAKIAYEGMLAVK